jgi:glycosyltransferase involved in cell wall biosynthesis
MRILHLSSHLNVGGVTSYLLGLSAALRQRGHDVAVASGGGSLEEELAALGVGRWRVPLATSAEFSPQVFAAARRLAARLRREPVDVLHAHTRVGQVVADRLSRRLGVPYVATWHGFFRPNLGRRLWPCTGTVTIAISEPVRQHLVRDLGVAAARIRLIPNGIDPAPFERPPERAAQQRLRERLRIPAGARIVGTVARLVPSKGVDQLIRSLPAIRRSVPEAHLVLVGEGEHRPHLERLIGELGVSEAVHFAGWLPQTHVALSLMEVFVFLPADREGFGLSLLEAMASGRPIVAVNRGGGAPWLLKESGVTALVEPGDADALAAAVAGWLRDGEAACRLGGRARAVVKERFSLERMADQVEAVYHELIAHPA